MVYSAVTLIKKSKNRSSHFPILNYCKGPFTQTIFAAIFLLLMHAIKWIDLRMY